MRLTSSRWPTAVLLAGMLAWPALSHAAPVLSDGYAGTLVLGPTSFSEADAGTTNPSAAFSGVPSYGALTISYGAYFTGQSYAFDPNNPAPPTQTGDAATGPLSLANDPDLSAIVEDDANATANPVVGGSIDGTYGFVGPIAILFSTPVAAAELVVGDLADAGQILLEAFAADGTSLGTLSNTTAGYETFDVSSTGGPIAGVSLRSPDPSAPLYAGVSGVGVFGEAAPVPAPGAAALGLGLPVLAWIVRRRARS